MQDTERPEEFLERARAIFEERESEFKLRQAAFEEKENNLNTLLQRITSERKALATQQEAIKADQAVLEKERIALQERSVVLGNREAELKKRQSDLDDKEKDQLMKYNLELEQLRNNEMKLQRLTEEYNYKLSLLDPGIAEVLQYPSSLPDSENYISIEEHEKKIHVKEERVQNLIKERDELKDTIKEMQEERTKLLNKIIEIRSSQTEKKDIPETEAAPEHESNGTDQDEGEAKEEKQSEDTKEKSVELVSETEEELTASVLQSYLKKNRTDFDPLEIRHSENGELLYAESRGLTYHFLFVEPSMFDISTERKNSSKLRKQLEACNEKFPGVQFRYDEAERKVYATWYFTSQLKAYELMKRVQDIADCFRQE